MRVSKLHTLGIATIVAALGIGLSLSVGHARPKLVIHPVTFCPYQTPEEWQRFLERYASFDKWVETCEDSACDEDFFAFVRENVQEVFTACAPFLARNPELAKCTANFRRFVPAWMRQHDSVSYGFNVDNPHYLADQDAADKPQGMMLPPRAIVAALPSLARVEEAARTSGLKYLTHDSAIDGIRTFVFNPDPQGRFDQWLLLNLKKGALVEGQMPLSVLTVQKKDASGHRLDRIRLHFRDYNLMPTDRGYRLVLHVENNGKCYSCHVNGVRQLIARHTPVLESKPSRGEPGFTEDGSGAPRDFAFSRLMEFNRKLRSYGTPDWDGKIVPEDFGPALGEAQGCTDCHNGKSRAKLNVATSTAQLKKKVYNELSMPYDTGLQRLVERAQMRRPPLSPHEEKLLRMSFEAHQDMLDELMQSRGPELKAWLLSVPCR